jgi:hypothetical protein
MNLTPNNREWAILITLRWARPATCRHAAWLVGALRASLVALELIEPAGGAATLTFRRVKRGDLTFLDLRRSTYGPELVDSIAAGGSASEYYQGRTDVSAASLAKFTSLIREALREACQTPRARRSGHRQVAARSESTPDADESVRGLMVRQADAYLEALRVVAPRDPADAIVLHHLLSLTYEQIASQD